MSSDNAPQPIRPGDLFYKRWGKYTNVHLFLPRRFSSAKKPFVRLSSPQRGVDATYNFQRFHLENHGWLYAGNVLSDRVDHPVFVQWEYEAGLYLQRHERR